ncbi:hypothetical protein MSSIH_2646 [Methanosarcina siciliae HI350]|uniref:Uncharacterized protein n=1 Tax=Methanosarcina siciliae HI350 TaxID=1434119 RepID=A0A0E3LB86_9EURY|nr:hypothetical protein [Methanosarcina siciliae]AKB33336.1 hypothetical protein MSSIH_2646 [Methanosarcina siciliae HI350]
MKFFPVVARGWKLERYRLRPGSEVQCYQAENSVVSSGKQHKISGLIEVIIIAEVMLSSGKLRFIPAKLNKFPDKIDQ